MEKPHSHTFRAIELNELNLCGSFAMQLFGSLQKWIHFYGGFVVGKGRNFEMEVVVVGAFSGKFRPTPKENQIS